MFGILKNRQNLKISQTKDKFTWKNSKSNLGITITVVLLWGFLACWAVSSPVGSAGDDNYHLASIWCSSTSEGLCKKSGESFTVPKPIAGNSYKCFIQWERIDQSKYNQSAKCINSGTTAPETVNYLNNNNKMYPNLYYDISGLFAGDSVNKSVISIRLFWGTLFSGLTLWILLFGRKESKVSVLFTILLFLVPVPAFLLVSTNPTAGCLVSLFVLPHLLKYFQEQVGIKRRISWIVILLMVLLSSGSRTDGGFFAVALITCWAILNHKSIPIRSILSVLTPASLIALGSSLLIITQSKSVGLQAVASHPSSALLDFSLLGSNLLNLYKYYVGIWGLDWSLGWRYEPELPDTMSYLQAIFLIFIIWKFIRIQNIAQKLAIIFVLLVLLFVPLYIFQISGSRIGELVQPRYLTPFVIGVFSMAMIELKKPLKSYLPKTILVTGFVFLSVSLIAFKAQLTRVTKGADGDIFGSTEASDWWWSGAQVSPGGLFILFLIITTLLTISLVTLLREYLRKETELLEVKR